MNLTSVQNVCFRERKYIGWSESLAIPYMFQMVNLTEHSVSDYNSRIRLSDDPYISDLIIKKKKNVKQQNYIENENK